MLGGRLAIVVLSAGCAARSYCFRMFAEGIGTARLRQGAASNLKRSAGAGAGRFFSRGAANAGRGGPAAPFADVSRPGRAGGFAVRVEQLSRVGVASPREVGGGARRGALRRRLHRVAPVERKSAAERRVGVGAGGVQGDGGRGCVRQRLHGEYRRDPAPRRGGRSDRFGRAEPRVAHRRLPSF